jgi:ribosomal protein RSM22 (predicted rRNA methylase)
MKKPTRSIGTKPITISPKMLNTWEKVILEFAKLPKFVKESSSPLGELLRQEKRNLKDLWEVFTDERSQIGRYLADPKKQLVSYLLGFQLSNIARLQIGLARLRTRADQADFTARDHIVLDLGAGAGAMSWGLTEYIKPENLSFFLLDSQKVFLKAAAAGLEALGVSQNQIITRQQKLEDFMNAKQTDLWTTEESLIIAFGYVWNEIHHKKFLQNKILQAIQARIANGLPTSIIVAEPANQNPSRTAMELRDCLVEIGFEALYPCPHQQTCPMLPRKRDWCFSEARWHRPDIIEKVDKMLDINRAKINSALYFFSANCGLERNRDDLKIVVGKPQQRESKHIDFLLCHDGQLSKTPSDGRLMDRGEFI